MNNPQREEQMLKGKAKTQNESAEQPGQFRDNPKVNARIDEHIKQNPKHWDYIQSMPHERLERALVLSEVNKLDRQQKMKDGILRKLERNPELKQAVRDAGEASAGRPTRESHGLDCQLDDAKHHATSGTTCGSRKSLTGIKNQSFGQPETLGLFAADRSLRCLAAKPGDFGFAPSHKSGCDVAAASRCSSRPHPGSSFAVPIAT